MAAVTDDGTGERGGRRRTTRHGVMHGDHDRNDPLVAHRGERGDDRRRAEGHQRARQSEQRAAAEHGRRGDAARRQHDRARHRPATLQVVHRERAVGERQRREQRVVGPVRAMAGEVGEAAPPEGLQRGVGGSGAAEEHGRPAVQAGEGLDLRRRGRQVRPGGEQDAAPRSWLTRSPAWRPPTRSSDGETDTGRPESPGNALQARPCRAPVGTTTSGRSDRRTRVGTMRSASRWPSSSSVARAAAFDAAEPWTRLSRWRANVHASTSSARPAVRARARAAAPGRRPR